MPYEHYVYPTDSVFATGISRPDRAHNSDRMDPEPAL